MEGNGSDDFQSLHVKPVNTGIKTAKALCIEEEKEGLKKW